MKRKSKKNKRQSRADLTKRLAGYSLTAGAVLAAGGKAQAGIISSGPMSQDFGSTYGDFDLTMEGSSPEARFWGASSFTTKTYYGMTSSTRNATFGVKRLNNNFQVNADTMFYSIYKLPFSNQVGQNNNKPNTHSGIFFKMNSVHYSYGTVHSYIYGNWTQDGQSGYFGFSFDLEGSGDTVYGWGQVERIDESNGRLLGWAYEDSGDPIHVGDTGAAPRIPVPSALGLAALGAAGVLSIRRRKKA